MADKIEPAVGDQVILFGPPNGAPLPDPYEVIKILTPITLRVKDKKGFPMRIHKSRIAKILKNANIGQQTSAIAAKEKEQKPAKEREEKKMTTATATAKPAAKEKEKKVPKEAPKPVPFDVDAWLKEHGGGVHLVKKSEFDHANFKLFSHVCIDEKGGYYYTINTYEVNGVVTLGKSSKGGNQYPLKGRRINQKIKQKNGNTATRTIKGVKTAEEISTKFKKDGYETK